MDVLSDVLRTLGLSQVVYNQKWIGLPWGVRVDIDASYVVHWVVEGDCWLSTEGALPPQALSTGDLVLVTRDLRHCLQGQLDDPVLTLGEFLAHGTQTPLPRGGRRTHLVCASYRVQPHPMLTCLPQVMRLNLHASRARSLLNGIVERIAEEALNSSAATSEGSQALIDQLSSVLLTEFVRSHYAAPAAECRERGFRAALHDRQLAAVLTALHESPNGAWSLARMARIAGMSRSLFADRFKQQLGESPIHYLTHWRMQRAAALLRDGDLSIQEVMSQVGYGSEATFSRAFKRHLGAPPAAYRRGTREADGRAWNMAASQ